MRKLLLTIAFALLFSSAGWAQVDAQKLDKLCHAIAHAEGFGRKGAIPTRYHNAGDLKSRPGIKPLPGQVSIGKGGHLVFRTDEDGWNALRAYIIDIAEGRRKHYAASMTLDATSRVYAQRWQPWLRIVTKELGVSGATPINIYLKPDYAVDIFDGFCYTL